MTDPNEDDDALFKGPSLNAEGRLEGRFGAMEQPVALNTHPGVPPVAGSTAAQAALQPPPPAPPAKPALELARTEAPKYEARIERFREENAARTTASRSRALKVVISVLLVGIAAMVAFAVIKPKLPAIKTGVNPSTVLEQLQGERPPMLVNSTPPGAKLYVGAELIGETPWAGDNRWAGEKVPYRLEAPGYRTFNGTFEGDAPVTLDVTLKK